MQFDNIPHEMRAYHSWVLWRYEQRDGTDKPTKSPYSPRFKTLASVATPASWGTYDEAVAAYAEGGFEGIGFVFSEADPFAGIDLDDCAANWETRHKTIFDKFDSYSERSPSGNGLHIIVKASVPKGRRREQVELYSAGRYFTMTGDTYRDAPINERQQLASILWAQMGGSTDAVGTIPDKPATEADAAILETMFAAKDGAKARDLYEGRYQSHYASQSEADLALINIIAYWTQSREQIERLFRSSSLGQRDKASRADYVGNMIAKAFDRFATLDVSSAIANANAIIEAKKAAREAGLPEFSDEPDDGMPTVDVGELDGRNVAPRQWLVEGIIPARNVTLISGDGGSGKSLIALQLCASTVLGRSWIGTRPISKGGALYLSAEDDVPELHRRMADIAKAEAVSLADLRGLVVASLADRDALLAVPGRTRGTLDPTPLYAALAARIAALKPSVVVIDTLADTFGGNEIERTQARQFVAMLRRLAIEFNVTVVMLTHPSQSGMSSGSGTSGSTAWSNSVRSRLYLKRDDNDADFRTLELMKSNYSAIGDQIRLRWSKGAFKAVGQAQSQAAHKEASQREIDEQFVKFLIEATERGQPLSPAPSSPYFAPKRFADHPNATANKHGFVKAMNRLFATGRIQQVMSDDAPSKQKAILAVVEPSSPPANPVPTPANPAANSPANLL